VFGAVFVFVFLCLFIGPALIGACVQGHQEAQEEKQRKSDAACSCPCQCGAGRVPPRPAGRGGRVTSVHAVASPRDGRARAEGIQTYPDLRDILS
jgi:hypothetical protein